MEEFYTELIYELSYKIKAKQLLNRTIYKTSGPRGTFKTGLFLLVHQMALKN